jgi:hypothetical protein
MSKLRSPRLVLSTTTGTSARSPGRCELALGAVAPADAAEHVDHGNPLVLSWRLCRVCPRLFKAVRARPCIALRRKVWAVGRWDRNYVLLG